MTPEQFRQARRKLGLSQAQLGDLLDTAPRTIRKWETGERSPNPVAVQAMTWFLDGFRPYSWPLQKPPPVARRG